MKTDPFIKTEPDNGDGFSDWWKNLPMFQPAKSEDTVKEESSLVVNLAAIPRNGLAPEKSSNEAVNFLSHAPKYETPQGAAPPRAGRTPTAKVKKQKRARRYQYQAYHRSSSWTVHYSKHQLRLYPTPRRFDGFCFNCGKKGHRQEICRHNIIVPEVGQKYWLAGLGVVGAINRLARYNVFRKDEKDNVFYIGDGTDQQVDGTGAMRVRVEVNKSRIIDIFDTEGNLFRSFWDTFTLVYKQ